MVEESDRVEALEHELRRSRVENQLWREAVAKLRELTVNYAPFVAQSQGYEGIQKMMASPDRLAKLVTERIEQEDARDRRIPPGRPPDPPPPPPGNKVG
jgi:hypothetical protein